jgi:hypothetical protein
LAYSAVEPLAIFSARTQPRSSILLVIKMARLLPALGTRKLAAEIYAVACACNGAAIRLRGFLVPFALGRLAT